MKNFLTLPSRKQKPRTSGLNCLLDNGLGTHIFSDIIQSHHSLIDHVKFGWGTSIVTKDIEKKISLCRENNIEYFFGGTLFEKALIQNKVDDFMAFCKSYDCSYIEVSNGTVDLSNEEKAKHISKLAKNFKILSEVGYKDSQKSLNLSPAKWIEYIRQDFEAGSSYVITEARESGTSGICRSDGELRFGLIAEIADSGLDLNKMIFEAPNKALQSYFISNLGPDVNLGNLSPMDIIGVETLRLGLRSDTLLTMEKHSAL